jgi:type II secretory pathway pseudopilin PulG
VRAFVPVAHVSSRPPGRRGAAAVWALVVLAVLAATTAAVTAQLLANRRWLDQRHNQLQAAWLARAGAELAAARLLTDPSGYTGEAVEPIPASQVRVDVHREPGSPDTFRVTSEARYPTDGQVVVLRSVERRLRRTVANDRVRIEVLADAPVKGAGSAQTEQTVIP